MATTRIDPLPPGSSRVTIRVYANGPGVDAFREFEVTDMISDPLSLWQVLQAEIDEWMAEICPTEETSFEVMP